MGKLEFITSSGQYTGLTDAEVIINRAASGKNLLTQRGKSSWAIVKDVVADPMFILLLIACSIYFFTGKPHEGIIMVVAITAISGISIFQGIRTEHAVKALQKLSETSVTVIRNGSKTSIPSEDLVPDDIMIVSEGQQMPADAALLEYNDLSVNESILTGESFPVEKDAAKNQLFSGTTISSGLAHARVTETGNNTKIGKLGITMEQTHKEKTPLEHQVNVFVKRMAIFGFIAFAFVTIFNAFKADSWMAGLMEGLTLAMAVIPEEIPVALSTFMALGAYRMMRFSVLVKQPQTVEALGAATVICVDKTGTVTENRMKVQEVFEMSTGKAYGLSSITDSVKQMLLIARLASEPIPFDPMEKAIVEAFELTRFSITGYKMINEYPLSGRPPMMTHVYTDQTGKRLITCKGAPEGIIQNSFLTEEEKNKVRGIQIKMAGKGNRVLAIAISDYAEADLPEAQNSFKWRLLGLLALSDPPKKNIPEVIKSFYDAGIVVKMITGDYPQTACGIAGQIGMVNPEKFITGEELVSFDDGKLKKVVYDVNVFARIQPEMKLRIINALKANGEVVAMTGDGVNDGPALKAAHIGIAMGSRGSEVARQAASLVLVNEDLANMVNAVALGRKIYSNLKKAIQYIITIHIPILAFVIVPLLLGWKYATVLTPVHIIFLELIMGPTCSIVYENEPLEE
ncbi:MAG TPA: HAD-IC family P-type ATPase, partial [Bacteroidia bacterium]|nr:HAD-IC family P-type ATPase [Bacteroidia bacterium]